jgi:1-acyl-sn-glycerol-3-phosphate acyltransferase
VRALRTLVCVLVLPAGLMLASAWAVVLALFNAPRRRIDRVISGFAEFCAWLGGTQLDVHGLEHLRPGCAYVIVLNHESNWDPVVLFAALKQLSLRGAFKKEILRIPFFGRGLLLTGFVVVERHNTRIDIERLRQGMASRPADVSVVFYAEGTRSRDGGLHAFKKGAFVTAITTGLPVLPVGTAGTYRIWQPGRLRIRNGPAVVEIGAPIPVAALSLDDRDTLCADAHAAVRDCRTHARQRLRALGFEPGGIDS